MDKSALATRVIDIDKMVKTACSGYVLQLLVLANDIDSLVELNKARKRHSSDKRNYYTNAWSKGSLIYLQRQNTSIVFESLDATISRIAELTSTLSARSENTRKRDKKPRILWQLIVENESLLEQLKILEEFRTSEPYKVMDSMRDKIGAHADAAALKNGLKKVVEGDKCNLGLVSWANNGQFRAFFVDELLVQQNLEFIGESGIDAEQFPDIFGSVRENIAKFSIELLVAFCTENGLFANESDGSNYMQTKEGETNFKFLPRIP